MLEASKELVDTIVPASLPEALKATQRLVQGGLATHKLASVIPRLCAACHSQIPKLSARMLAVVAADHGIYQNATTSDALRLIASNQTALNRAALATDTQLVLVDAGLRTEPKKSDIDILSFPIGPGTRKFITEAAMSKAHASAAIQTGIALGLSLADAGMNLLALGCVATLHEHGALASTAVISALCKTKVPLEDPSQRKALNDAWGLHNLDAIGPLEVLTRVGGYDTGVLVGLIFAAASLRMPIVLDDQGTSAAALIAVDIHPDVGGYLFASHAGHSKAHAIALQKLELRPLYNVGLAQGEGAGAVMAIPILDAAVQVLEHL